MKTISVNVAELKAKLSEYLRMVRKGARLVILDHQHPIARVEPLESPEPGSAFIQPLKSPILKGFLPSLGTERSFSSLDILLEDRNKR